MVAATVGRAPATGDAASLRLTQPPQFDLQLIADGLRDLLPRELRDGQLAAPELRGPRAPIDDGAYWGGAVLAIVNVKIEPPSAPASTQIRPP